MVGKLARDVNSGGQMASAASTCGGSAGRTGNVTLPVLQGSLRAVPFKGGNGFRKRRR
jgi:hypothetical protein